MGWEELWTQEGRRGSGTTHAHRTRDIYSMVVTSVLGTDAISSGIVCPQLKKDCCKTGKGSEESNETDERAGKRSL